MQRPVKSKLECLWILYISFCTLFHYLNDHGCTILRNICHSHVILKKNGLVHWSSLEMSHFPDVQSWQLDSCYLVGHKLVYVWVVMVVLF